MAPPPAFILSSNFVPRFRCTRPQVSFNGSRGSSPVMTASNNLERMQEIEKLQKQLAQLRARRDLLTRPSPISSSAATTSASSASTPTNAPTTSSTSSQETFPSAKPRSPPFIGKHSSGSRFLSIFKVESEEYFPRILTIAGRIPELTVEQYMRTPPVLQNRSPEAGNMFLTMLPDGYHGQIVALPGTEAVGLSKDPVAVLVDPNVLSDIALPVAKDDDVIIIVERDIKDIQFEDNKFYLWQVGEEVRVGWMKDEPDGVEAKMIGKVIYGMLEVRDELRVKKSCWEEENETYAA